MNDDLEFAYISDELSDPSDILPDRPQLRDNPAYNPYNKSFSSELTQEGNKNSLNFINYILSVYANFSSIHTAVAFELKDDTNIYFDQAGLEKFTKQLNFLLSPDSAQQNDSERQPVLMSEYDESYDGLAIVSICENRTSQMDLTTISRYQLICNQSTHAVFLLTTGYVRELVKNERPEGPQAIEDVSNGINKFANTIS